MQQEKRLKRVALLNGYIDLLIDELSILTSIKMVAMGPIIAGSWDVIDHVVEQLPDITFNNLICNSFLHINQNCPSLQLIYLRTNGQSRVLISISEIWTQRLVIFACFIILYMLFNEKIPKSSTYLISTLSHRDCNVLSGHLIKSILKHWKFIT